MKLLFLLLIVTIKHTEGFTYYGSCPDVQPKQDFQINRMLGAWYVIKKSNSNEQNRCLHYDIFKTQDGKYQLTAWFPHSYSLTVTTLYHEHQTTGTLTSTSRYSTSGRMVLDLPSENSSSIFTVFMADYNRYAVVYRCQNLHNNTHKWSLEVLSRTRSLNRYLLSDIQRVLPGYLMAPFNLYFVHQSNCPTSIGQKTAEGDIVVGIMNNL